MYAAPVAFVAFAALVAGADREPARLFTLVNASDRTVTAVAVGSDDVLDAPLQGGLAEATVRLPAGGCMRDFRVTFRGGGTHLYGGIDVCRFHRLRLASWQVRSQVPV